MYRLDCIADDACHDGGGAVIESTCTAGLPLADIALVRIGGLAADCVERLRSPSLLVAADAMAATTVTLDTALSELAQACHTAVKGQRDALLRRRLIALKRDAHNRRLNRLIQHTPAELPQLVRAPLAATLRAYSDQRDAEARLQRAYQQALRQAGGALRELATEPAVFDAVTSATRGFEHTLAELASNRLQGKRLRRAEDTFVAYLARASVKTSPFGRLGIVAVGDIAAAPGQPVQRWHASSIRRRLALNIAWVSLASECSDKAGEAPQMATAHTRSGDTTFFIARDERNRADMPRLQGSHERGYKIRGAVRLEGSGQKTGIHAAGDLQRLRSIGLVQPAPPVPMQQWANLGEVATGLEGRGPVSAKLAGAFREAQRLLKGAEEQPLAQRRDRFAHAQSMLTRLLCDGEAAGTPSPLTFEDSVAMGRAASLERCALEPALQDLATVLEVGAAASIAYARKRTLAERIYALAGERPMPLLEAAVELLRDPLTEAANPLELPDVTAFLAARQALRQSLRDIVQQTAEGELYIDPATLSAAWRRAWPPPHSPGLVSAMVQLVTECRGGPKLVLNGALPGGGKLFSRFLSAADPHGYAVQRLRRHMQWLQAPIVAEVCGVHGFNANLHPPIAPYAVDYPGTPSVPADWPRLSVSDLFIRAGGHPRLPRVSLGADGEPVALVDLAFLSEALMPPLRRLLGLLSAQATPDLTLLQVRLRDTPDPAVKLRPRLSVGRVVVSRRSHRITTGCLPGTADPVQRYLCLDGLARRAGLPDVGYVRPVIAESAATDNPDAAAVERKPLWLDRACPLSMRLLGDLLKPSVEAIDFSEALPNPLQEGIGFEGRRRVAEWVLELALGTSNDDSSNIRR